MEVAAVLISAIGVFYAARAATAARETVRLTRRMRWEADVRRVLEALVAIQFACEEIERRQGQPNPPVDNRALIESQRELARAMAYPPLVTEDDTALSLLERLRSEDLGPPGVSFRADFASWAAGIRANAMTAENLILAGAQPAWKRMPAWYIRLITFRARRRAARGKRGEA